MYEQKLSENPFDVHSILGCMTCYDARGDWQRCLNLAEVSWAAISDQCPTALDHTQQTEPGRQSLENRQRALKLCAQASWRLGQWDSLESYTSQLVHSYDVENRGSRDFLATTRGRNTEDFDFDSNFYRSVLHVHRREWDKAANSIDSARRAMDSRFTALLSESYKRAYPSMVSAQTLSEVRLVVIEASTHLVLILIFPHVIFICACYKLEEIVNFRQFEERTSQRTHLHAVNRPDEKVTRDHLLDVWRSRLDGCRVDAEVHSSILAIRSLVLGEH